MWSRKDLKTKAKERLKVNYWKMVLVALILTLIAGTASMPGNTSAWKSNKEESSVEYLKDHVDENEILTVNEFNDFEVEAKEFVSEVGTAGLIVIGIIMIVMFFVILVIAFLLQAFVLNPIIVGCHKFFYVNLNNKAEVKEVGSGFDKSYKNGVKVMFFRDLYTFLWSLLLIIPGIVKTYEYRMIPYILGENPEMDMKTAFATSKQMMSGNKWRAFVLDLSFLGWRILALMTCGILNLFYVNPYKQQTNAALYESLKDTQTYEE